MKLLGISDRLSLTLRGTFIRSVIGVAFGYIESVDTWKDLRAAQLTLLM